METNKRAVWCQVRNLCPDQQKSVKKAHGIRPAGCDDYPLPPAAVRLLCPYWYMRKRIWLISSI